MRAYKPIIIASALVFVAVLLLTTSVNTQAVPVEAVIDFEGIAPGTIVEFLHNNEEFGLGYGISGATIEGRIIVFGFNPDFPPPPILP